MRLGTEPATHAQQDALKPDWMKKKDPNRQQSSTNIWSTKDWKGDFKRDNRRFQGKNRRNRHANDRRTNPALSSSPSASSSSKTYRTSGRYSSPKKSTFSSVGGTRGGRKSAANARGGTQSPSKGSMGWRAPPAIPHSYSTSVSNDKKYFPKGKSKHHTAASSHRPPYTKASSMPALLGLTDVKGRRSTLKRNGSLNTLPELPPKGALAMETKRSPKPEGSLKQSRASFLSELRKVERVRREAEDGMRQRWREDEKLYKAIDQRKCDALRYPEDDAIRFMKNLGWPFTDQNVDISDGPLTEEELLDSDMAAAKVDPTNRAHKLEDMRLAADEALRRWRMEKMRMVSPRYIPPESGREAAEHGQPGGDDQEEEDLYHRLLRPFVER